MTSYQKEELYKGIINIDDQYIEEAQETNLNMKCDMWKRYAAIAACLCLVAVSAITMFHRKEQPIVGNEESYNLSLFQSSAQGQEATEICTLSYTDDSADIEHFVTRADGTIIPAVYVATSPVTDSTNDIGMTLAEAQSIAYIDLDTAPDGLQEKILRAREVIIYSQSWVADGFECYITSPDGTKKTIPAFSELFPDWEIPAIDTNKITITADGLGSSAEYGIFVEITEINTDYMMGKTTSSLAPFEMGQNIQVYFPAKFDASCIEKGKIQFVSFYGKDCNSARGTVYAHEISAYYGDYLSCK